MLYGVLIFIWAGLALADDWQPHACLLDAGHIAQGFPAGFTICWHNPTNHTLSDDVLKILIKPKNYQFDLYRNSISGIYLDPQVSKSKLVVYDGKFYLLVNSMDSRRLRRDVIHYQKLAAEILKDRDDIVRNTRKGPRKNQWWEIFKDSRTGRYALVSLADGQRKGIGSKGEGLLTPPQEQLVKKLEKEENPAAVTELLLSMNSDELIDLLNQVEPRIKIEGRGVVLDGIERKNLSPLAKQLAANLIRRFHRSTFTEYIGGEYDEIKRLQNECRTYCYKAALGEFELWGRYDAEALFPNDGSFNFPKDVEERAQASCLEFTLMCSNGRSLSLQTEEAEDWWGPDELP